MTNDARPVFGEDGHEHGASVKKLRTGIPGFDVVTMGGPAEQRTTVLVGQAGSAKTVFAGQFLAHDVRQVRVASSGHSRSRHETFGPWLRHRRLGGQR